MALFLDVKYANLVSGRLEKFKIKTYNPYTANFRCPLCGDSKKNIHKARGFFFQKADSVIFKCHNCGAGRTISTFLRDVDPSLQKEYMLESYTDKDRKTVEPIKKFTAPVFLKTDEHLAKLKKISQLSHLHPAKRYVVSRKIPNKYHAKLYYCSKFASWTNSIIPDKLKTEYDEPRLIIPFFDKDGRMFGYQGRSFDPDSKVKYITIMLEDRLKTFGLDMVDTTKRFYCVEGPIDSMFLPNAIAMAGSDMNEEFINDTVVFILDNEPRNAEIVKRLRKYLEKNYSVFIWPDDLKYKDINDAILGGMSEKQILDTIDSNIYKGLAGMIRFNDWRKT